MRTFTFLSVDPMAPPHALQGRVPYSVDAASIGAYRQLVEPWHVKHALRRAASQRHVVGLPGRSLS